MGNLAPEQIRQMFADFGLEGEEQRASFLQMGSQPQETTPSIQVFIRTVSSSNPEGAQNNA
jgi:hypothetical protein